MLRFPFIPATTNVPQYPFEYSKTRVQLLDNSAVQTSNPLRLISQVAKQEGVGALYTGCSTLVIVSLSTRLVYQFILMIETGNCSESRSKVSIV